jgi:hypothetical protein
VRKPVALKATPAEIVERGDELREQPAAPDKLRRGFPGPDQPPAQAATRGERARAEDGAGG